MWKANYTYVELPAGGVNGPRQVLCHSQPQETYTFHHLIPMDWQSCETSCTPYARHFS